jgi:hypothetical protein
MVVGKLPFGQVMHALLVEKLASTRTFGGVLVKVHP